MRAEYIDHMGSDLTVVNAARVSFAKQHDEFEGEKDARLIRYLARHGHWTPFSHAMVTMRETVPIFISRQRFKHMIGFAYNEVSRRYVDEEPEFYWPDFWRKRPEGSVKQGSGGKHRLSATIQSAAAEAYGSALRAYNYMLREGVAPEQARMVLPQSMMTSYYVTGSLAAWARAYRQRIDSDAQVEIQQLARQWGEVLQPLFPVSWASLTE